MYFNKDFNGHKENENFFFSWTLTGKDAEALLFQEEDEAEEEQDDTDPLHKLLKSKYSKVLNTKRVWYSKGQ